MKQIGNDISEKKATLYYFVMCLLLLSVLFFSLPVGGLDFDTFCWKNWAKYIFENGLGNVYESETDYLPLYHYILAVFGFLQGSLENIENNINYLKIIGLLFHFTTGFFLLKLIKNKLNSWTESLFSSLFYVLNIAILYNLIIWGQVDGILTCFIFLSFYFSFKKRITLGLVFLLLALNFKLQAIIFIPLIGLMLLPQIIKQFSFKRLAIWVSTVVVMQLLILMPFILAGTLSGLGQAIFGSVDRYAVLSMNAFNYWALMFDTDQMFISDNIKALGISYKNWGYLMFFSLSFITLLPLLISTIKTIFKKSEAQFPIDKLLIIAILIPILFFYFNTQMHERYSHPALVFVVALSIINKKPLFGILVCVAYLLNMDAVYKSIPFQNYDVFIFSKKFISVLYLISIGWLYAMLFNKGFRNNKVENTLDK